MDAQLNAGIESRSHLRTGSGARGIYETHC